MKVKLTRCVKQANKKLVELRRIFKADSYKWSKNKSIEQIVGLKV